MELVIFIACLVFAAFWGRFWKLQGEPFTTNSTARYSNTASVEKQIKTN